MQRASKAGVRVPDLDAGKKITSKIIPFIDSSGEQEGQVNNPPVKGSVCIAGVSWRRA